MAGIPTELQPPKLLSKVSERAMLQYSPTAPSPFELSACGPSVSGSCPGASACPFVKDADSPSLKTAAAAAAVASGSGGVHSCVWLPDLLLAMLDSPIDRFD